MSKSTSTGMSLEKRMSRVKKISPDMGTRRETQAACSRLDWWTLGSLLRSFFFGQAGETCQRECKSGVLPGCREEPAQDVGHYSSVLLYDRLMGGTHGQVQRDPQREWRLNRLSLSMPAAQLSATGAWRLRPAAPVGGAALSAATSLNKRSAPLASRTSDAQRRTCSS